MTLMSPRCEAAGVIVTILPPLEAFPDSIFVEDPALVFSEGRDPAPPGCAEPRRRGRRNRP